MYNCETCGQTSEQCEKLNKKVVQRRKKNYTNRFKVGTRMRTVDSSGWEIVKEIKICSDCFKSS